MLTMLVLKCSYCRNENQRSHRNSIPGFCLKFVLLVIWRMWGIKQGQRGMRTKRNEDEEEWGRRGMRKKRNEGEEEWGRKGMRTKRNKDEEEWGRRGMRTKRNEDEEEWGRRGMRTKRNEDEEEWRRRGMRTKNKCINEMLMRLYYKSLQSLTPGLIIILENIHC